MSSIWICDGCGQQTEQRHTFRKPERWYERTEDRLTYHACSRECIEKVAAKFGGTKVVLPI